MHACASIFAPRKNPSLEKMFTPLAAIDPPPSIRPVAPRRPRFFIRAGSRLRARFLVPICASGRLIATIANLRRCRAIVLAVTRKGLPLVLLVSLTFWAHLAFTHTPAHLKPK
jgi:hypothetical protein